MGVRMKEHEGSIVAPSAGAGVGERGQSQHVPPRRHHPGRARRVRFAVWVTLVVVVVCLLGAIASPAKTSKKHHAAVAASMVARPSGTILIHVR